jgi:hypothetical protein
MLIEHTLKRGDRLNVLGKLRQELNLLHAILRQLQIRVKAKMLALPVKKEKAGELTCKIREEEEILVSMKCITLMGSMEPLGQIIKISHK